MAPDTFKLWLLRPSNCDTLRLSWNPALFNDFKYIQLRDAFWGVVVNKDMKKESTAVYIGVDLLIYAAYGLCDGCDWVDVKNLDLFSPQEFYLYQNYPNPFNPTTTIQYDLPKESYVRLILYDVLGREIRILVNERQSAGTKSSAFDGTGLPSGIYFYRLQTGQTTIVKKMILTR